MKGEGEFSGSGMFNILKGLLNNYPGKIVRLGCTIKHCKIIEICRLTGIHGELQHY